MRIPSIFFRVCLILQLTGWNGMAYSQDEKNFQLYTAGDGLSNNNLTAIAQDNHGYIWISSLHGLNRYDGRHFVQFHSDSSKYALPDENVSHLIWLDKNRLAACTGIGLHIVNTLHGETEDIIIPVDDLKYLYKFNTVMSALSDPQGNIYILTRSGFYQYDNNHKLVFRFDYYSKDEIETSVFAFGEGIYWLSDHEILVSANDGSRIYNTQTQKLNKINSNHPFLSEMALGSDYLIRQVEPGKLIYIKVGSDSIVYINKKQNTKNFSKTSISMLTDEFNWRSTLFRVNDSLFYFSSRKNGFFKMHLNKNTGKIVIDTTRYLSGYLCTGFVIDTDNRLWIATNAGLLKEKNNITSVQQIPVPPDVLKQTPDLRIHCLYCYKDKLYAGCLGNAGLLVFDKKTLSFLYRISFRINFLNADLVYSILQAHDDTLFIATAGPLFWLKTSTGKTGEIQLDGWDKEHDWIPDQIKDSYGNIWVSTNEDGKIYLRVAGEQKFRRVEYNTAMFKKILVAYNIKEDQSGNIWMGGHGICRISRATFNPDFYLDSFPYIRFPRKEVTAMAIDKNNILWAGINNNGLAGYNIDNGGFQHYTTSDGLPDNLVKSIYPIDNKLWIATATGIASMDMKTNKISRFSSDEGFSSLPVTSYSFFYDSAAHYLYSAFTTHIVRFNPDSLFHAGSPPSFFIENIHFLNDTTYYYPGENITVPYYKNNLTVTLGSVNYNDVSNQRIDYRIVNSKDSCWQTLTSDLINFNNLSPGTYQLQVKLYTASNRWPVQEKEIDITIMPPFWKTPWFIISMSIMLLFLVYMIYVLNINVVRKTERAKVRIEELKAEEFKNRLELEKISSYFSSSFSAKKTLDEVLWDVARNLIAKIGYTDCMIYLWNADKTRMEQKAGYGPKGSPEAINENIFYVVAGQGIVGHVMQTKQPLLIHDTRKDNRYRKDDIFRLSEICVPIIHNGELLGIIDSEHEDTNYYKERDLNILTTIATLVGNKMKQIESEHSLEINREELASINEQLAEAQLTALQTQMNPHFIFNALNSIKRMILDNENRNASRYLSKFAQMIRLTLNHSKETFVTLQETIEYLHAYLDMEQLRFGSSFSYTIEKTVKHDEEDISVPTLMIQPLAENAIWHGLMHKEGDKKITIQFVQTEDTVTCTITDNGVGINHSEKMKPATIKWPHVGLDNLRNRIKIMNEKYDMNCSLVITDLSEKNINETGTSVVLQFKILN